MITRWVSGDNHNSSSMSTFEFDAGPTSHSMVILGSFAGMSSQVSDNHSKCSSWLIVGWSDFSAVRSGKFGLVFRETTEDFVDSFE